MEQKIKLIIIEEETSTQKILEHFLKKEFEVAHRNYGMEGMNWMELGNNPNFNIAEKSF